MRQTFTCPARIACCLVTLLAIGCGSYEPTPLPQVAADAPEQPDAPAPGGPPPGYPDEYPQPGGPQERRAIGSEIKRYPLTNVVGVFLGAKQSIENRTMEARVHQIVQQFRAIEGRVPDSYEELEAAFDREGFSLPDLKPGYKYVFDPSDQKVYVEGPAAETPA